jgi:hypothetical protein
MSSKHLAVCLGCLLLIFSSVSLKAATLPKTTSYYVALTWNAPVDSTDPVVGYYVFRSSGSTYSQLTQTVVVPTAYDDNAMSYPAQYSYYVVSVDAQGNISGPSNYVSASIPFVPYTPVLGTITD